MKPILRQMRIHQWSKNLLLCVPFLAAHEWSDINLWQRTFIAFVAFSCLASVVYILNDICDLEKDRLHPIKKNRPLAAGKISLGFALATAALLLGLASVGAWILGGLFWAWCLAYFVINIAYSLKLKSVHSIDVLCLASLYTLRIMAGGEATDIAVSHWLLTFSAFLFLSLAMVKRISEILRVDDGAIPGRDYSKQDLNVLLALGTSSAYATVLVLALYLHSPEVSVLYSKPNLLWLLTPLSIYWLTRLWILTMRGQVHEDPVIFALKDPVGWGTLAAGIACLAMAT